MDDRETVISVPHAVTRRRRDGKLETRVDDPRVSVAMQEDGATLTLFFDREEALAGTAPLLEIRLEPPTSGVFEPWRLLPNLPLHLQYARASLAWKRDDANAALRALRQVGSTRRGLSDDHLRLVARLYDGLVAEGEPYPAKALAKMQHADKSTVSRWLSAARARGFLEETS